MFLILNQLLMFCGLLGLGSSWNQPGEVGSCYKKWTTCSSDSSYREDIRGIRESLQDISDTLRLIAQNQVIGIKDPTPTDPVTNLTTGPPPTTEPPPLIGSFENPASSCSDIPQDSPSGEYWIKNDNTNSSVQVYCDMNRTCCNSITGGWTRVANLDMTDSSQQCPDEFRLVNRTTAPLRTCGRPDNFVGCVSTTFPVHEIEYSHVCGRVIGYQFASPNAFEAYFYRQTLYLTDNYVDGVSLTHGQSPVEHIWTFAAALGETSPSVTECPCIQPDLPYTGVVPPFIGQDYFCETASRGMFQLIFYPDDPLWDGQGCGGTSTCCSFNNPPWFCKQLPQPTTDDIELRLCADEVASNEDTPLEIVEIYVK